VNLTLILVGPLPQASLNHLLLKNVLMSHLHLSLLLLSRTTTMALGMTPWTMTMGQFGLISNMDAQISLPPSVAINLPVLTVRTTRVMAVVVLFANSIHLQR